MRTLTDREKRTLRLAGILVAVYLVLFYGAKLFGALESRRGAYAEAYFKAQTLQVKRLREIQKRKRLEKLKAEWNIDFTKLQKKTVVGDARVALEATARTCGVGLGFSRESPGRTRAGELTVFQVQGSGKTLNVARFLHCLKTRLGYPMVVDRIHLKAQKRPDLVAFTFTATLLGYSTWKPQETSRA